MERNNLKCSAWLCGPPRYRLRRSLSRSPLPASRLSVFYSAFLPNVVWLLIPSLDSPAGNTREFAIIAEVIKIYVRSRSVNSNFLFDCKWFRNRQRFSNYCKIFCTFFLEMTGEKSVAFKPPDAKCLDYSSRAVRNTAWRTVKYDSHKFPRATNFHQLSFSSSFFSCFPSLFSGKSETLDTFLNLWERTRTNPLQLSSR